MMSLGKVASSGAAEYYAADNYYTLQNGTDQSLWDGRGAQALGLEGKVETAAFERILEGKLPDGSELNAARGDHRPGEALGPGAERRAGGGGPGRAGALGQQRVERQQARERGPLRLGAERRVGRRQLGTAGAEQDQEDGGASHGAEP